MADKKNDSLFQWNFNLEDSDSDFTDIDFSNTKGGKAAESDKDIQPIIFVRDETARKKPEEKRPQTEEPAGTRRQQPAQKKAPAKKPAPKKKKKGSAPELNWKLIAVIAAGVLLVAAIVLLLGRCGKKEDKAWTKVEADSKVKAVMDRYFEVKKDGDAQEMRKVLVPDTIVNASVLGVESYLYTDYTDIVLQQYPGIKKEETVVCATYDTILGPLEGVAANAVPTISWFYVLPDSTNNLRLMTITEMEKEENKSIYNYVVAAYSLLADTTVKEVETRYKNAVESNSILKQYLQNIQAGNYYTIPTAEDPTDTPVDPTQPSEEQPSTSENPGPGTVENVMYVSATTLNMRSAPTTAEQNVIWKFSKGYCVTVISAENGWYRIKDDVQTNPGSGLAQSPTYAEGYVSADWLVSDYSTIQW